MPARPSKKRPARPAARGAKPARAASAGKKKATARASKRDAAAKRDRAPRNGAATPPRRRSAAASVPQPAPPPRPPAVFVGRDRELAQLDRGLDRVPVAVVCGLAGVGKSSLAYAAAAKWQGPAVYARATGAGLSALLDELRRALGATTELRTDDERAGALARALDGAGAVAIVDDLHVLPPADQAWLLGELGAHLERGRLIGTSRERPASAQGYDRVEIHLGGLPARAARELWTALDELRGATAGFQRAFDATGGNPFLLRRRHAGDPSGPDPLAAAVAQLAPDRARLLGAIALARVPLPADALAAVAGADPRAALTDLRRALLVDLDGDGRPLVHELVRDAALATLAPATRAELAAALAAALADDRTVAGITAVAHHWLDAGLPRDARDHLVARAKDLLDQGASRELAAIAASLPPSLRDPEVAALHARALVRLIDVEAGERALRDALAARPPSGAVLLPLATLALLAGRFADARLALTRAAADPDLPPLGKANVAALDAAVRFHTDAPAAALEQMNTATQSAHGAGRALLWATATYFAWLDRYAVGGERRGAPTSDNRAPAAHGYRAAALGALAFGAYDVATTPADSARALQVMEAALAGHHDPLSRIHAEALRGLRQWEAGDRLAALDALRALTARAEEAGYVLGVLWTSVFTGRILHVLGRRMEARAVLASVADRARALGAPVLARAAQNAAQDDPVTRLAMAVRDEAGPPSPSVRTRAFQAIAAALRGDDTAVARALGADGAPGRDGERPGYHVEAALAHLAVGLVDRRAGTPGGWANARAAAGRALASADSDLLDALLAVIDVEPGRAAPPVVIDTAKHEVVAGARVLSLGTRPVLRKLLYALAERPGETLSKDDLTRAAWTQEYDPLRHDNPLFVNVSRLRQLLKDTGLALDADNDRGGYRLTSRDQLVLRRPR